ncbi:hypothetical protein F0919_09700 [Taibaiella lutea]|uniref:Addiction module protein n=1 Tax=Taibaiella lutea TaxID=2608001 RepID=A0A5M6CIL4_9BACT|nr:addiction module protein [Taibaiella lutea]KAA5534866.1 hypothetical protein F0919_09700 [Taibaiella lutea]
MTAATIRNKLHSYLEVADAKKLKALYTIIEAEIEETLSADVLTDEQMEEIETRRADYLSGKSKVHTWKDAKDSIG